MFSRLRDKLALRRRRAGYHSQFGGLWTDRLDAPRHLGSLEAERAITREEAQRLRFWMEHGYVILPGAVDCDVIDVLNADIERAWRDVDRRVTIELDGEYFPLDPELRKMRNKLLDFYVHSEAARATAFAAPIQRFLQTVFERETLLFQSLSFERGSEQPIHQDTAYVAVDPPMAFAASWVALEDIRPGSGELHYYPGSHRLPDYVFRGGGRNWNRKRDGLGAKREYENRLHNESRTRGLKLNSFLPRKGDALLWSADLAHGGSAIENSDATRRSLVSHYCPKDAKPYYFSYRPDRRSVREYAARSWYSSSQYSLANE